MIQSKKQLLDDIVNSHITLNQDKSTGTFNLIEMLNETFNTAYRMGLIKMFGENVEFLEDYE